MSLEVGIVGIPNSGKSTLFNALIKAHQAKVASHPFTTIDPNIGVVEVPDETLDLIAQNLNLPKKIPATIKFVDIAGLIKNAHLGEGLGNQFLSHIKNVDAICHVVRAFEDQNVPHVHNKIDPQYDIEIVNTELELAGISKPTIYLYNVSEHDLENYRNSDNKIYLSAQLESDLIDLKEDEQREYLESLNIKEDILSVLIKKAYQILNLITFYTLKANQIQAWSILKGTKAIDAAGKVHTDMQKGFIVAWVISSSQLLNHKSLEAAKKAGELRTEGKNYIIQDKEVVHFKFNV